jgi:hypothetical protein
LEEFSGHCVDDTGPLGSGRAPIPVSSGRTDRCRLALGADAGCVVIKARPAAFRLL